MRVPQLTDLPAQALLLKLDHLSQDYQTACLDRSREMHYNREGQLRESKLV